ncbi:uncharacterized protein [Aegilops tauschii subsp. strangulata]|uniref:uncharacterized protein n=1 Tax=Aegilops tauschii subsp. strangulata TaxID=200361 RepID=UPI00098A2B10
MQLILRSAVAGSPPSLMDSEDILAEILLRLSPHPSSLPRASLVCKRWRRLVTDPGFIRRFAHHCKQPIIGVFFALFRGKPSFRPTLDPPDSIPPDRFSLRLEGDSWHFHGCRHGRVLLTKNLCGHIQQVLVWDPVTGDQRFLGVPRHLEDVWSTRRVASAVVCAAGGKGGVHGGFHSSPFKVVLLCNNQAVAAQVFSYVYSSETGAWGNLISESARSLATVNSRHIMVGNSLYWFVFAREVRILEFDMDTESFAEIERCHRRPMSGTGTMAST